MQRLQEAEDEGSYQIRQVEAQGSFRKIVPDLLALPPPGHKPVDATKILRWPYNELFSETVLRSCLLTADELEVAGPAPKCRVSLAEDAKYSDVLKRFMAAGMLKLVPAKNSPGGPINGLFAVDKPGGRQRPVVDARAGNWHFSKERFQAAWERIIASRPEQAAKMHLDKNIQGMPTPATMSGYPDGAFAAKLTDKGSFFYTLLTLRFLVKWQRIPRIWGELLGLAAEWMDVYIIVMAMGNWLSAALAHLIHVEIMWRIARGPILLRRPTDQTPRRRALYAALLRKATGGAVKAREIPSTFLAELKAGGHPGFELAPGDLEVPVDAFRLQMVSEAKLDSTLVHGDRIIELHTALARYGADARRELAEARYRSRRRKRQQILAMVALYLDDNTGIYYDSARQGDEVGWVSGEGAEIRRGGTEDGWAAARLQTVLTIATSLDHGFIESWKKLRWPSEQPGKALGVEFSFGPQGRMRWEVDPVRRFKSRELRLGLSRTPASLVSQELYDTAVGNLVWEQLCRRSFLSVDRVIYSARHSPNRPTGGVFLSDELRFELWLSAVVAPCYSSQTTTVSGKLTTYDASGKGKNHDGGYGVAERWGLDDLTAAELLTTKGGQLGRLPAYAEPEPGTPPLDRGKTTSSRIACKRASRLLTFDWDREKGPWRATHRGGFKRAPAYIAIAESATGLLAARGATKRIDRADSRANLFLLGGDNTVACTCYNKGRSSTAALNTFGRRLAVTEFVREVYFGHFWLPSKSNPADGPSRWMYEDRRPRNRVGRLRDEWIRNLWMDGDVHPHPGPLFEGLSPKKRRKPRHRFRGRHVVVAPKDERAAAGGTHSLMTLKQKDDSFAKYLSAFDGLTTFIREKGHRERTYGRAVAAYVNEGFNRALFSRAEAQTAVTACGYFCPEVKARGELKRAGQYIAAWHKAKPTKSHRPLPKHVNDLLCLRLLQHGDPGAFSAGVAGLLGFSTYARHSELCNLRAGDVRLPDDSSNFLQDRGTIYLRKTKAGVPQTVVLDDAWVNRFLRVFIRIRDFSHDDEPFFDFGKLSLLDWFRWAQMEAGYNESAFVIHSMRHGGATHDFMTGSRNVSGIKVRGRWKSYQALQIYLQAMQANLAAEQLPEKAKKFFHSDTRRAFNILSAFLEDFERAFPARPVGE